MKAIIARVKAMSLAAIALCALTVSAEIKYWDNPAYKAFDVDDYVQDGLLLHYDGIRNAGATAGHDPNATVWKNLGTGGASYDMTRYSLENSAWIADGSRGAWKSNGFEFSDDAVFHEMTSLTIPTVYTFQLLVDATADDQADDPNTIGYVMCDYNANNWAACCIGIRQKGGGTGENAFYFVADKRPHFNMNTGTEHFSYATAIHKNKEGVMFPGVVAPWGATDGTYNSQLDPGPYERKNGISLGGHYPKTSELFKGTLNTLRFYTKALTNEELTWNRVVDEARFFGRAAALPVTNVVVASNIPIAFGDEPIGCYAVDGTHVFSAPASKVIKGRTYILNGYTIETWDGEKWSAAQEFAAESGDVTSYTAADTALVRLTWKWTAGDGLVNYDADDYVQYGLVLNYDGIRNAGHGVPHNSAAKVWKNLGNGGAAYDMTRYSYVDSTWTEGDATGTWKEDGFVFNKNAVFCESKPLYIPSKRTMQVLVDAKASEQGGIGDVVGSHNGDGWDYFSICMRSNGDIKNSFYIPVFGAHIVTSSTQRPAILTENAVYDYGTAIVDGNDAVWYAGTTAPWNAEATGGTTGHLKKDNASTSARTHNGICLGGRYPNDQQRFKGTIKLFRFYTRCLTDEEVAWNRIVDDWRYSPTRITNVVVATTRTGVFGNEKDGAYQVANAYTFTAPESVTVGKFTYAPTGYAVQVWDEVNGVWDKATEYTGSSYAYTTSVGKVRLLWRWKVVKGIRTLADYDVTDYIAGGLLLNYDGIRNAGVSAGHDSSANVWVNLGTAGAGNNAVLSNEVDAAGYWTASGYKFDGKCRFIAKMAYNPTYTLQFLSDAVQDEQSDSSNTTIYFICGDADKRFAFATYDQYLYPRIQNNGLDENLRMLINKESPVGYVTSIQDQLGKSASVFSGTVAPVSGVNFRTYESMQQASFNDVCIGGWKWGLNQNLRGGINYFRYYDRVLSEEELAWNREVDEARYFGVVPTDVVVVTGKEGSVQAEAGAYKVDGEWTFTASKVVDSRGRVVDVARYYIEELVDGVWVNRKIYNGSSYTYTKGASSPTVRLKWLGQPEGMSIIVR